ncbi:MAG: transcription antitermination factor NusB [Rhodothermales bacterium]
MGLRARIEAARQLEQDEDRRSYTGHARRGGGGDAGDERQITDLVSGVTRWRRYLDFLVDHFYSGDPSNLDRKVRTVLRMGLYELVVSGTASHAAINESVELAKKHAHRRVSGLVNGILRAAQRAVESTTSGLADGGPGLPEPRTGDRAADLAIRYSHPDWMVRRWLARWPEEEVIALLQHNNAPPTFGVLDMSTGAVESVTSVQGLIRSGALARGDVRIQDVGAAQVVDILAPEPGMTILDVCAAPGGKAIASALRLGGSGRMIAADIHADRLGLVRDGAAKAGLDVVETRVMDARHPDNDLVDACDAVLIDAPCSGLGVLSKRADMRWQRTEGDLEELIALQREILGATARCVRPGGILVYSTCTTEPEENERQVEDFLAAHPGFVRDPIEANVPLTPSGDYLALPQRTGHDGAYAARLRRL